MSQCHPDRVLGTAQTCATTQLPTVAGPSPRCQGSPRPGRSVAEACSRPSPALLRHQRRHWTEPVEPSAFYRNVFRRACADAGIAPLRLHDLRHTYASMSLARGEDYKRLSEQMGHSSYVITLNVYAHLIPADDDAASVLDLRPATATKRPAGKRH